MNSITVDVGEMATRFGELAALAETGAEVIVRDTDGHRVKLTPLPAEPPRRNIVLGMHPGAWLAPDFNDPLPDEFWGGAFE